MPKKFGYDTVRFDVMYGEALQYRVTFSILFFASTFFIMSIFRRLLNSFGVC
jgi:hypothetical protein